MRLFVLLGYGAGQLLEGDVEGSLDLLDEFDGVALPQ